LLYPAIYFLFTQIFRHTASLQYACFIVKGVRSNMKKVLTIAGSDSCGGAGIQADLKTMSALGVYGMSVITAVTAQNTQAVHDVLEVGRDMVQKQMEAIFDDIEVDAVKIGMVSNADMIAVIRENLLRYHARNIVVDPVMVSKSGYFLLRPEAVEELRKLIAIADVATPNIPEAETLCSMKIENEEDMKEAARRISDLGVAHVLVKGGHRCNNASDVLYSQGEFHILEGKRIETPNTHGTGCTLSSAIASLLAKGKEVHEAVQMAKQYITTAIENSFGIGKGVGPVGHFIELYQKGGIDYE
jgi:hydroxymethylpyrimidine/phosphomethylpyrimidine kinase